MAGIIKYQTVTVRRLRAALLLAICYLLFDISGASAAELHFEPDLTHEGAGFTVNVVLKLARPVNAVQGVLEFDDDILELHRIDPSPSGVPLWIETPALAERGRIPFAGIFPGGIEPRLTDRIVLFRVAYAAERTGSARLSFNDVRVLLHTAEPADDEVITVPVTAVLGEGDLGIPDPPEDRIAPEPFTVNIVTEPAALAVFNARDLQSGVARYEVRERFLGLFGGYAPAVSPYELSAAWRWSIIDVRAADHAGNVRTARHVPAMLVIVYGVAAAFAALIIRSSARWRR
ncbi:MAG TPA: hypothetical protein VD862_02500 [Candidatus Paceibacterota bacterium]|nr:hypothetical protein [Candidatus Paceibacterota bacterium]